MQRRFNIMMARWAAGACMVLGSLGNAHGQDDDYTDPRRNYFNKYEDTRIFFGGLTAGINMSQVDGDMYSGYNKLGFNGGAMVYVKLSKRFLASVQMLYSQRGSRGVKVYDNYYTGAAIEKYYLDLNYVEVPLVFHFLLNEKWQAGIGASYSQLLNSKEDAYSSTPVYLNSAAQQFRKQDVEFIISGTMQIYRGWFLDATYQYSLNTIRNPQNVPVGFGYGSNQFNNLFSLRLVRLIRSGN